MGRDPMMRRLLWFVVGLMLGGFAVVAFADDYPAVSNGYVFMGVPSTTEVFPDPTSACLHNSSNVSSRPSSTTSGWYDCQGQFGWYADQVSPSLSCPGGGSITNQNGSMVCVGATACDDGEVRDLATGQCVTRCADAGSFAGSSDVSHSAPVGSGTSACIQGCRFRVAASVCSAEGCTVYGPFTSHGSSCSEGESDATDPPAACEFPNRPGEINGVFVCIKDSGDTTTQNKDTTASKTDPAGNTGSTDQGTTTTCTGDKCTTTTTRSNTGGGVGSGVIGGSGSGDPSGGADGTTTTHVEQSKGDFCAANPTNPVCSPDGSFGGSCDSGFTCSGDAVQCATARAVWINNCDSEWLRTPGDPSSYTDDLPEAEIDTTAISPTVSASGSCPPPIALPHDMELSFEWVCMYASSIRPLFIALAYIAGIMIVLRGVNA